ncbi:hypothetical protein HT051_12555 [Methyloligella sp. GL2]|nr:hypothetical protein HT051_12555 [Methyloligella sp. GL2]
MTGSLLIGVALAVVGGQLFFSAVLPPSWLASSEPAASDAGTAQDAAAGEGDTRPFAAKLQDQIVLIVDQELRQNPSSSGFWLWLADLRKNRPPEEFNAALLMSQLTAPNEAYIMQERAILGISRWDILTPELRRSIIRDTATVAPRINAVSAERYRRASAGIPETERHEIGETLATYYDIKPYRLKRLGLAEQ